MSCGQLQKFEDFCPISDSQALIAHGANYPHLNEVLVVDYSREDGIVKVSKSREYGIKGTFIRLGNIHNGILYYSDDWSIKKEGSEEQLFMGLQPYATEQGIYYQRRNDIWLNDKKILPLLIDYLEMGRPCVVDDWMYYEVNQTLESPKTWEIWRFNLQTRENEMVLPGANPYVYKDVLFYSYWIGTEYELRYLPL